jgi:hypothetical protein
VGASTSHIPIGLNRIKDKEVTGEKQTHREKGDFIGLLSEIKENIFYIPFLAPTGAWGIHEISSFLI